MLITQMHNEFKLLLDKGDSLDIPNFLSSEIDSFLSMAQDRFVTKRAFGNNVRRTGFEEDQKRRDDLRTLIVEAQISPSPNNPNLNKPNGQFINLPDLYRHAINEEAFINKKRVSVKPITHDRYNKIIDDPFNKPLNDTVYRLDYGEGSRFELISGEGQTVETYYLRYIRKPGDLSLKDNVSSLLPDHTHREIIRMAVLDALENVEQPRYQSSKIELNEIE